MRLENKMNKWLKLILKSFVFLPIIFLLINTISYATQNDVSFVDIDLTALMDKLFRYTANTNPFYQFEQFTSIFTNFNHWLVRNFMGGNYRLGFYVAIMFEYWLMIDLFDLTFSAFRFIIDICRSWLDGFYDKNKGGYK